MTTICLPVMRFSVLFDVSCSYEVVPADIVDVAPHLPEGTFAVHLAVDPDGYREEWTVTNIETGYSVGRGPDREYAIACARTRLSVVTPEQLEKQFAAVEARVRAAEAQ